MENIIYYRYTFNYNQLNPYLYSVDFIFYNCFSPGLNWLGLFVKHKLKSNFMLKYMECMLIFACRNNNEYEIQKTH